MSDEKAVPAKPKKAPVDIEAALDAFAHDVLASIPALRETENHNRFRKHIDALKKNLR